MPPVFDQHSFELISRSADQTRRVGMRLGAMLQPGDVIGLVGELGSGKTTMMQGIASGWGSLDPVSSPTFVLVNVYRRTDGERFYHLDAYRLRGAADALDLDLETMQSEGPLVVEWADRIESVLPEERIWAQLEWVDETRRQLVFSAHGARCQKVLRSFRNQIFGVA